jgi:cell wall-associated NlpC family hydrolase
MPSQAAATSSKLPARAEVGRVMTTRRTALLLAAGTITGCASVPAPEPEPSPAVAKARADLVLTALNFLDVDYKWGGTSAEEGFDCSGFTRHVYQTVGGIPLPRTAEAQASAPGLRPVPQQHLAPGDLVFFDTLRRAFSHVGIYVGDGRFVHAPRTGAQVRIENMRSSYWASRFSGARRSRQL